MFPCIDDNGKIWLPRRAEGPGILGDAFDELATDDPDYAELRAFLGAQRIP